MRRGLVLISVLVLVMVLAAFPAMGTSSWGKPHPTTQSFTVFEVSEKLWLVENDTRELGPPGPPDLDVQDGPAVGDVIVIASGLYGEATYHHTDEPPMQFPGAPLWDGSAYQTFDEEGPRIGEVLGDCRFVRWDDERERTTIPPGFIHPDTDKEDRLGSCILTMRMPGGDLVMSGVLDITALEAAQRVPLSVTGGTGDYHGATGTATLQQPSVQSFDRFRIDVSIRS